MPEEESELGADEGGGETVLDPFQGGVSLDFPAFERTPLHSTSVEPMVSITVVVFPNLPVLKDNKFQVTTSSLCR